MRDSATRENSDLLQTDQVKFVRLLVEEEKTVHQNEGSGPFHFFAFDYTPCSESSLCRYHIMINMHSTSFSSTPQVSNCFSPAAPSAPSRTPVLEDFSSALLF